MPESEWNKRKKKFSIGYK